MGIKFYSRSRLNPRDPTAPPRFYPQILQDNRVSMRRLAGKISQVSTLSTIDVVAVLEAFLTMIPEELSQGNAVELGDFGTFWVRTRADGVDTIDEVSSRNITRILPRFYAGVEFKRVLNQATYEKIENTQNGSSSSP